MIIQDYDLRNKQYSIEILEKNIDNLTNKTLLYTQKLTADFCAEYILNEEYACCVEETYINFYDVLQAQKHITKTELYDAIQKYSTLKLSNEKIIYTTK